jgi:hypothetical protein
MHAKLNLPPPSDSIINQIRQFADAVQYNTDSKRWLEEFHSGRVAVALHSLGNTDAEISRQMIDQFQPFFPKHRILSTICVVKNADEHSSCLPSHIDRGRALGINYFIELGGDQVETVFYNLSKDTQAESATNIVQEQTGGVHSQVRFDQGWYGFRANQCHSVENIQTTRIFTTIRILTGDSNTEVDYTLDNLINDYENLIDFCSQD